MEFVVIEVFEFVFCLGVYGCIFFVFGWIRIVFGDFYFEILELFVVLVSVF